MELIFNEQDLIDSVCVYVSEREQLRPDQVDVDLEFNDTFGFAASALFHGRTTRLNEQDLIDAIAVYLRSYHQFIPESLLMDLSFSKESGIGASIKVKDNY